MTTDLDTPALPDNPSDAPVESVVEELSMGSCCSECGAPGADLESSWCRECGFYSKYGSFVDLDAEFDDPLGGGGGPQGIPPWVFKCGIATVAVIVTSVLARLILPRFPAVHMVFGMTQLLAGVGLFLVLHFMGFFRRSLQDSGAKLMDFLSPFAIWAPVFHELPKSERKVISAWTGLCAAFFALVITGGQPTSWLEFKETVVVQEEEKPDGPAGPGGPGGDDLEGAVEDFAEKGTRNVAMPGEEVGAEGEVAPGGDDEGDAGVAGEETEEEEEEELLETECLIIGYMPLSAATAGVKSDETDAATGEPSETADAEPDDTTAADTADDQAGAAKEMPAIRALVLASQVNGRLCVVGYATEGLTVDNANEMLEQFSGEVREAPFVTCRAAAIWINPKFICNVKYKEWDANQGLIEPMFDGMLKILP